MPSRKKAKGKARKAAEGAKEAEAAKAKEEESRALALADQQHNESIEALLHRLVINDVTLQKCQHGYAPSSPGEAKTCTDFINEFIAAFLSQESVAGGFVAAIEATGADQYTEMYGSKLDMVVSLLLSNGTQSILDGNKSQAKLYASIACNLEDSGRISLGKGS